MHASRLSDPLKTTYAGAVWAMRRYFRGNDRMRRMMDLLLKDICREFGWKPRLTAPVIGAFIYKRVLREEKRLASGWGYEPADFYEKNPAALSADDAAATACPIAKVRNHRHAMA